MQKSGNPVTLAEALRSHAERNPHQTVCICGYRKIDYEELDSSSTRLAAWLLHQGINPGDRIAIHWPNAIETVQLFFAAFKAGLIAVPVNLRLKAPEIEFVLEHSGATLCFSHPSVSAAAQAAAAAGGCLVKTSLPDELTEEEALPHVNPDDPAVILYTSGTTARPKGVVHTHRTLLATAKLAAQAVHYTQDDSHLTVLPLMHAAALTCILFPAILLGATVVMIPAFDPAAVLDGIQRFRCTSLVLLPALLQFVLLEQEQNPRDVASLRRFLAGGDSVPLAMQQRALELFGLRVHEVYGLSEGVPLTANQVGGIVPGSLGRAVTELRIVDSTGRDVPDGTAGEIAARGPNNCVGYWNDPTATAELLRDGWLYTGDLAERDTDGYYWFRGRLKQIIIRAGSNISPQEVEEILYRHPAVFEAGVVGKPDPVYGETVAAFVSLRPGVNADEIELREFARQQLADYKTPETIVILPELPKGLTGKVLRRALKEMLPRATQASA
jgi:long-chain acyl-CoA synthetase